MKKLTQEQRDIVTKYGYLFVNTGGNDIIELVERDGVNYFNNPVVAELQGSCYSQIQLLLKLRDAGLLVRGETVEHEQHSSVADPSAENTLSSAETSRSTESHRLAG